MHYVSVNTSSVIEHLSFNEETQLHHVMCTRLTDTSTAGVSRESKMQKQFDCARCCYCAEENIHLSLIHFVSFPIQLRAQTQFGLDEGIASLS